MRMSFTLICLFVISIVIRTACADQLLDTVLREVPLAVERAEMEYEGKMFEVVETSEELLPSSNQSTKLITIAKFVQSSLLHQLKGDICIEGSMTATKPDGTAESLLEALKTMVEVKSKFGCILNHQYFAMVDLTSTPSLSSVGFLGSPGYKKRSHDWSLSRRPATRFAEFLGLPHNLVCDASENPMVSPDEWSERQVRLTPKSVKRIAGDLLEIGLTRFPATAPQITYDATLTLDPKRNWSVIRFTESIRDSQTKSERKVEYLCEYPYDQTIFHPTQATLKTTFTGADPSQSLWHAKFSPLQISNKVASDYLLTAYGLPEPKKRNRRSATVYIVSAIVLGLGIALFPSIRRRFARE